MAKLEASTVTLAHDAQPHAVDYDHIVDDEIKGTAKEEMATHFSDVLDSLTAYRVEVSKFRNQYSDVPKLKVTADTLALLMKTCDGAYKKFFAKDGRHTPFRAAMKALKAAAATLAKHAKDIETSEQKGRQLKRKALSIDDTRQILPVCRTFEKVVSDNLENFNVVDTVAKMMKDNKALYMPAVGAGTAVSSLGQWAVSEKWSLGQMRKSNEESWTSSILNNTVLSTLVAEVATKFGEEIRQGSFDVAMSHEQVDLKKACTEYHLIAIPAGVMLLQYAPKDSRTISYVRWSMYKKTDRVHVLEALETIMGSYAFFESTDHKPLRDLMRVE